MTPLLDALLTGLSTLFAFVYALLQYVKSQTRIATATGGWLDLTLADFFGNNIRRSAGQSDASVRAVITANLFRPRATRQAVISLLTQLTGRVPFVYEPSRISDTFAYDAGLYYDAQGGYSADLPFQSFVIAFRPLGSGVGNIGGYDTPYGCYDTPYFVYTDPSMVTDFLTDQDIFDGVNATRPAGYTIWLAINP